MNDYGNEKETKMTIKLEVGKAYKLNNGEVHKCKRMRGDDPLSVDKYGSGPFVIDGFCYHMNGVFGSPGAYKERNVASCVDDTPTIEDDTPTLWLDMTPEEKGALLLAHHEGKVIEYTKVTMDGEWREDQPNWRSYCAYRIKPKEPKKPREFWVDPERCLAVSYYHVDFIHVREVLEDE